MEYVYDKAGRITARDGGAGTIKYTYDANGNVLTASDATGTVKREYDALNRVTKYTDIYGQTIQYEYDCCGNLTKMTYPTGETAEYTYDTNHNMVTSGVEGEDYTTTYEYNAQNQVTKIHNIDGGTVTKSYDSAGRLQLLNDTNKNGKVLFVNIFTYDVLGRITSELNPIEMIDYRMTYDSLGRVTQRTECDYRTNEVLHTETFTYDSAGNILTAVSPDGTENTYQYDQNNFIEKMNEDGIGVMVNGNTATCMINGKKVDISYDITNRLKKIDGDMNEYWYDADNNRINMYYYHTNMKYAYDCSGGRSRLVWTSDHNLKVTSYYYGAEGLLWSRCDGEYQVYHYDYRGSVVAVTDIDGTVTDTLKYDAYGSTIERTGDSALIFGYNGQYGVLTDPNGLLYMRTRFYNPDLKRFMNADIIEGSIADSTSLNLYTYVNGNPISFVDPFGMSAERGNNRGQNNPSTLFGDSYISNLLTIPIEYTYDRGAAIEYALKWTKGKNRSNALFDYLISSWIFDGNRNNDYYSYKTNCANFVSQCAFYGGIPMNDDWHSISKLNIGSSGIINYLYPQNSLSEWDISSAWRQASAQYEYFKNSSWNANENGDAITITSSKDIQSILSQYSIRKGDLMYFFDSDEEHTVTHATMISDVDDQMIYYTGNTVQRFNNPLADSIDGYGGVYIISIKDSNQVNVPFAVARYLNDYIK